MLKKLSIIQSELGISRATLYAMRRAGLPMRNVGAGGRRPTYAVDDAELAEFMDRTLGAKTHRQRQRRRQDVIPESVRQYVRC